jgi:hypothetical protein
LVEEEGTEMSTIDLRDLSRGYPFLDLARRTGEDYGRVLAAADVVDSLLSACSNIANLTLRGRHGLRQETADAVVEVCRAEWRWQFHPVLDGTEQ